MMIENNIRLNDFIFNYYFLSGALFLVYLIYRIIHSLLVSSNTIKAIYRSRGHTWRSIDCNKSIPYSIYCTVCGKLMLPIVGLFCECCAVSACKKCCRLIDRRLKCKQIAWPENKPFYHQWVNVGSAQASVDLGSGFISEDRLKRFFCSWCHRTKVDILDNIGINLESCDFQKYKNIIIPPTCVQLDKGSVAAIKPPTNKDWEPLIVFANRKSGSYKGDEVLSLFRGVLNPIQVIDISRTPPEGVVRWLPRRCRVLAAGGDGTVAWILNALRNAPHTRAGVAILPMGTGNDLSRVLGWGATCSSNLDVNSIIHDVTQAEEQYLDTWTVSITSPRSRLVGGGGRSLFAHNYVSLGVDAQVALDFHRARRAFLYRYANRTLNYIAYAFLGANRAFDDGGCQGLEQRLRVRLDDNPPLELPPIQALVLLNIPSWGAGVDLWSMGDEEVGEQSICDGKMEVAGVSSSFHIARLQCGLAEPYRFGQASKITIELSGSCAMQVDGEPWLQRAATIHLARAGASRVLAAIQPHE